MAQFEGRSGEGLYESRPSAPDSIAEAVSGLSQGMNALVRGHLALARVEAMRDLRAMGKDAAIELSGVPLLMASYLLLWFGIGYALALAMPAWASFLICSGVNLVLGLALIAVGRARMKRERKLDLPASTYELRRDRELAARLREAPAPAAGTSGQLH